MREKILFLVSGGFFAIAGPLFYYQRGYSPILVLFWILSSGLIARFFSKRGHSISFARRDFFALLFLAGIFMPLYFWKIYTIPFQVNTDEITIMFFMKKLSSAPHPDIFTLSEYFYFPSFIFIVLGWAGKLMGGITLFHMRIIHAAFGLGIIFAAYIFFRLVFKDLFLALAGALIVGSNHALLAISRMAMRDNIALFLTLLAFIFLLRGFQKRSPLETYIGGFVVGLTFYNYFPGRISFALWALFLTVLLMFFRSKDHARVILYFGGVALVGFFVAAGPIIASTFKTPDYGATYARQQLLIYPEAQELERFWEGTQTVYEAMYINLMQGLTVFNQPIHDHGYIYPNYGHGFVDPLTGALIWLGFLMLLFRYRKAEEDVLILIGFLVLWLGMAIFTTKNPNYTRYLLILPFLAGLVIAGLRPLYTSLEKHSRIGGQAFLALIIGVVIIWNLSIFWDFAAKGLEEGNDVGGTARYVEVKKTPGKTFYLAANHAYPYYSWGESWQWQTWLEYFISKEQKAFVVAPEDVPVRTYERPFSLLMSRALYQKHRLGLMSVYPQARLAYIKPDGSLVALEVD